MLRLEHKFEGSCSSLEEETAREAQRERILRKTETKTFSERQEGIAKLTKLPLYLNHFAACVAFTALIGLVPWSQMHHLIHLNSGSSLMSLQSG